MEGHPPGRDRSVGSKPPPNRLFECMGQSGVRTGVSRRRTTERWRDDDGRAGGKKGSGEEEKREMGKGKLQTVESRKRLFKIKTTGDEQVLPPLAR